MRRFDPSRSRDQFAALHDWQPSWQNSLEALMRVPQDIAAAGAFDGDRCLGYGALLPPTSTIAQLAVSAAHRRSGLGSAILANLAAGLPRLDILNVDASDAASRCFFERQGAELRAVQVEMIRPIASRP